MGAIITESRVVEKPLIKYAEKAGWTYIPPGKALELRRGESGKLFYNVLREALIKLNSDFINDHNVDELIQTIDNTSDTMEGNKQGLEWARTQRTFFDAKGKRNRNVKLIDFLNVENNVFHVTPQWAYKNPEYATRPDVVFLINGMVFAIVENKNPRVKDSMEQAIQQLKRMERETPEVMTFPQVFSVTDTLRYFYGATWNYSRKNIFNWKREMGGSSLDSRLRGTGRRTSAFPLYTGNDSSGGHDGKGTVSGSMNIQKNISLEEAILTFFNKERFLKMIKDWILFFYKNNELQKTILKQHQTRAVEKIVHRCNEQTKNRALVWHTQGSGKTFTMLTAARLILEADKQSTVMMIVDRNELEGQLDEWISHIIKELKNNNFLIEKTNSKKELRTLLQNDFKGLILSTIHKFKDIPPHICTRNNFYVFIDEAHRSVEGELGNYLTGALPNATFIGFTGTPIDKTSKGKGTFKVFGKDDAPKGYLDKYSIAESIEDGTTVKLKHSLAPNEMRVEEQKLEEEFFAIAETEGVSDIETLNEILKRAVTLRTFLKSDDRVDQVARWIAKHFTENVHPLGYKAFLTAVDREACALYKKALDKYLDPKRSKVIYTTGHNDSALLKEHHLRKEDEKKIRKAFTKPGRDPQILIVTDKLLTGFDAPILYCMYLDKPMRDHVLLQAIARVNRPYEDATGREKPCGLIVDFVGIFKNVKKALCFDSDEVQSVIEDLDKLMTEFKNKMEQDMKPYLSLTAQGADKWMEKLVYETFLDPEERKKFFDRFKEVETLYEILSPDKQLRPYLEDYQHIATLYETVKRFYNEKTNIISDVWQKTEKLIQESANLNRFQGITKTYEINEKTLQKIKEGQEIEADNKTVIDLIRSIQHEADQKSRQEPHLISIAEKSKQIMRDFEEKQTNSKPALEEVIKLMEEKTKADKLRAHSGLSDQAFSIAWVLQQSGVKDFKSLAIQINESFDNFKHFYINTDEQRQLKMDIYQMLLEQVPDDKLVKVTEEIIQSVGQMKK